MAEVEYDPAVIRKHAQGLYDWAASTVTAYTFGMGTLGLGLGVLVTTWRAIGEGGVAFSIVLVFALLFGGIGYLIGESRACGLRLQAQIALCQVQIEENTRRS